MQVWVFASPAAASLPALPLPGWGMGWSYGRRKEKEGEIIRTCQETGRKLIDFWLHPCSVPQRKQANEQTKAWGSHRHIICLMAGLIDSKILVFLFQKSWGGNCPAVFFLFPTLEFVMQHSWQIQISRFAKQVGWVGQAKTPLYINWNWLRSGVRESHFISTAREDSGLEATFIGTTTTTTTPAPEVSVMQIQTENKYKIRTQTPQVEEEPESPLPLILTVLTLVLAFVVAIAILCCCLSCNRSTCLMFVFLCVSCFQTFIEVLTLTLSQHC